jgi:hypothetical protein
LFTVSRVRATRAAVAASLAAVALIVAAVVAFAWTGAKLTATADCRNITVTAAQPRTGTPPPKNDFDKNPTGTLVFDGPNGFTFTWLYNWNASGPDTQVIATVPLTSALKDGGYSVKLQSDTGLESPGFEVSRADCSASSPPPSPPPSNSPSGGSGGGIASATPTDSPSGEVLGATAPGLPRTGEAPGS